MPPLLSIIQKSKCQTSLKNKKEIGIRKDTKEKTTCKLVVAQASTFYIVSNFAILPILNSYSKRKVLMIEHMNDKFQMHG
jgi:hypothetical protein